MGWKGRLAIELAIFAIASVAVVAGDFLTGRPSAAGVLALAEIFLFWGWSVTINKQQEERIDELQREIRDMAQRLTSVRPETGVMVKTDKPETGIME